MDEETSVYSVTDLNRSIRSVIESKIGSIWVEGEISNFIHHSSGHMYLTLKDESSQVSAVFFSRQNRNLKFKMKNGLKVLAFCRVSVYEPRGQYQIYIEKIQPKGLGELQLAFMQLKEKLHKEGLFNEEFKKPIPLFPKKIGVITSPTGAAIKDILNVIGRRFQGVHVLLNPVKVQGDGAAEEVAEAIEDFKNIPDIDVIIAGRGGGSLEDLWAFNEEVVARAIFKSEIPIISAVGHEIDWTISDWVADLRAPTPSAAAELVTQHQDELLKTLSGAEERMRQSLFYILEKRKERFQQLKESYGLKQPRYLVDELTETLDELTKSLSKSFGSFIGQSKQSLSSIVGRLDALSPLSVLNRGYSITFDEKDKTLRNTKTIKKGDLLTTKLFEGKVISKVEEVKES